jgi:hypothetical protein
VVWGGGGGVGEGGARGGTMVGGRLVPPTRASGGPPPPPKFQPPCPHLALCPAAAAPSNPTQRPTMGYAPQHLPRKPPKPSPHSNTLPPTAPHLALFPAAAAPPAARRTYRVGSAQWRSSLWVSRGQRGRPGQEGGGISGTGFRNQVGQGKGGPGSKGLTWPREGGVNEGVQGRVRGEPGPKGRTGLTMPRVDERQKRTATPPATPPPRRALTSGVLGSIEGHWQVKRN